jgi:hypothetical protein
VSLRDLARAHLQAMEAHESRSRAACPVSGHIGLSGPDKVAQSHILLGVEPVRAGYAIRTGSQPDKPDDSDSSDALDSPDKRTAQQTVANLAAPPTQRCESCNAIASFGVGCFPTKGIRGRWYCAACLPTEGEG